jgi:hypothetical protein
VVLPIAFQSRQCRFSNQLPLEFREGHQHVLEQAGCRIGFIGVDILAGCNEPYTIDRLRPFVMLQAEVIFKGACHMTAAVKNRIGLTVPPSIQHEAGFRTGDVVEFKVSGGVITILPKLPSADDEYTPEQRRSIDVQLDEAEKGPFHGPFNTAGEAIQCMRQGNYRVDKGGGLAYRRAAAQAVGVSPASR